MERFSFGSPLGCVIPRTEKWHCPQRCRCKWGLSEYGGLYASLQKQCPWLFSATSGIMSTCPHKRTLRGQKQDVCLKSVSACQPPPTMIMYMWLNRAFIPLMYGYTRPLSTSLARVLSDMALLLGVRGTESESSSPWRQTTAFISARTVKERNHKKETWDNEEHC